jgi:ParB family chromosome partitioning protein
MNIIKIRKLLSISIARITPNPDQPRKRFNKKELYKLANSIKNNGIIEPLLVRISDDKGYYQLIAGERRLIAAEIAGKKEVPVVIVDAPDDPMARLELALIENVVRADLNPIEEAQGYSRLEKEFGCKIEEIANLFGKGRATIINSIRLLDLPEPIKDDIKVGRMTSGHGRAILSIADLKNMMEARSLILSKNLSVREAESLAKRLNKNNKPKTPKGEGSQAFYESLAASFTESLDGLKVIIKYKGEKKRIDIYYNDKNDIQRFINKLGVTNNK